MARRKTKQARAKTRAAAAREPEKQVGLFVTKELGLAVDACKATVERIAKECRLKNQRFRDHEFDLEFDTFRCLHGYTEWASCNEKDVQRVTQIFDDPHFFPPGGAVSSNAIRQGDLGDCYFLSALATVSCIPGLIEKICVARDEEVGVYGFIFYGDNGWASVIVDDMLFTKVPKYEELDQQAKEIYHEDKDRYNKVARKGGSILLYAKSGSQEETWVPLVEKAYAKFYGNFAHLTGGYTHEAIEDITGGVATAFITKDILDVDRFWREELLKANKDRLFACGFDSLDPPEDDPYAEEPMVEGLFGGHAYAVLRAVECKGKRFVVVRNPWGTGEWTGAWADGSKEWTAEWLQMLPLLGHSFGDDGQFVMEYKDFLKSFNIVQKAFLFDDSWLVSSSWISVPLSEEPCAWSYGSLSFLVTIPTRTKAIIVLSRLNDRFFRSIKKSAHITLDFAVVKVGETIPIETASETRPFACRTVSLELELDAGAYIVYVRTDREDFTGSTDDDMAEATVNTSTRVISRILSNKVRCQSLASNWNAKAKSQFTPKTLEQIIAEENKRDDPNEETNGEDKGEDTEIVDNDSNDDDDAASHSESDNLIKHDDKKEQRPATDEDVGNDGKSTPPEQKEPKEIIAPFTMQDLQWRVVLEIFTIGCLNLLALFGLTLLGALEASPAKEVPSNDEYHGQESHDCLDPAEDAVDDPANYAEVGDPDSTPEGSSGSGHWHELLQDDGSKIILGLRVYTQTKEPAIITGRVKSEDAT